MKKIFVNLILLLLAIIILIIATLATIGIETNKFNKLISDKASQTNNIKLDLDTIKFKINPSEFSLFLETKNPKISYRNVSVPVSNIKVYIDFISLIKSKPKIQKTSLRLEELDITQLKKLSIMIKPSNFKSLVNNKIKKGKLISEIEIFLTDQGTLKDFIAKGKVKNSQIELLNNFNLKNLNLDFFADKNDILVKNIFGDLEDIRISDGDIKLNLENGMKLNSNFSSKLNFNKKNIGKYTQFFDKYKFAKNVQNLKANFNNNLFIDFDSSYKVRDYNYSISGKIEKSKFEFLKPINNTFITEEIKEIYLSDLEIKTSYNPKNLDFKSDGKYSFNNLEFLKINLSNIFKDNTTNLKLNLDFDKSIKLDLINYHIPKNNISNISVDLEKKKDNLKINKFILKEDNNLITIYDLIIRKNKFSSFKKVEVSTTNNDFIVQNNKKILIKGSKFDATQLAKSLNNQSSENKFKKLNSKIEIDFKDIKVPMSEKLENFKLIGEIKNGQFIKISSKGDFGENNFLDISMKKDKNSDKKYLEIYSDLTRPLLAEYGFFNGLSGGKLIFTSTITKDKSNSKLKIEDFNVVNAPGVIKLLSLADLGGLADLAKGEGLSFDILEINMEKNKKSLKINEILALGPSISVLMDGYQDENGLTSLRGTLVPAKTFNKMISKIPVIGNIVIPKEVGEGLFGISFKMKGPKGKVKTTINPIRTLTPRFIQKIIDREKTAK